jgi:acyl-CoA synthetase (AMP-forming)/AMP-acid ligase II
MMSTPERDDHTLRWSRAHELPPDVYARICGPGAPYELVVEDVLGSATEVFAGREPHLRAVLTESAHRFGDRPFLLFPDETVSFADMETRVAGVATVLDEHYGIRHGDRVAFAGSNHLAYVLGAWATIVLGGIAVGLNRWWTGSELAAGVSLTAPKAIFADETRQARLHDGGVDQVTLYPELLRAATTVATTALPDVELAEDDPAIMLFTSGTTGAPKAAVLSHRALGHLGMSNAAARAVEAELDSTRTGAPRGAPAQIMGSPLFHVSGASPVFVTAPRGGTTLVFPPTSQLDPAVELALTERYRVTTWSGVPTRFWRLLEHPGIERFDLSSVAMVSAGGSAFSNDLIALLHRWVPGARLALGYAMTESPAATVSLRGEAFERRGCVGPPLPGVEVQVRDATARVLDEGEVGEICLRGPMTFSGYWEDDEATADAWWPDRWYRSGDFGRIEDGLLFVESRIRDLIIRGGENVYPAEIEHRLLEHVDVEDAAVVGIPHRTLGEEVKAVVVLRPGAVLSPEVLQDWVAAELAGFKVPEVVDFRTELPYTGTGKVLKRALVDE